MTDNTVKTLRDLGDHASFEPAMHHVAADRIEALERHLENTQADFVEQLGRATACELRMLDAEDRIEKLLEEIQQLKHDSTIFINERSYAICENFDLREENAELRDEIEKMRERRNDWRAAMTENHDLWREVERMRKVIDALEGEKK